MYFGGRAHNRIRKISNFNFSTLGPEHGIYIDSMLGLQIIKAHLSVDTSYLTKSDDCVLKIEG